MTSKLFMPAKMISKNLNNFHAFIFTFTFLFFLTVNCYSQGPNVNYQGPIKITKGGTYSGNWQSTNSSTPAVVIATSEPVIIQNSIIRSAGNLIYTNNTRANVTIRNTQGYGLTPTVDNKPRGRFFHGYVVTKAILENNYMEGTSGVQVERFEGNKSGSETIRFRYNKAKNIDGRHRNGGKSFAQMFQLNECRQVKNVVIEWNEVINEPGKGYVEDNISIHLSSGTSDSPIQIRDNYIKGAYPLDISSKGYSGGGIMLADGSGTSASAVTSWVRAYNNQVVSTSNYGIAIAGGNNNLIYNNKVVACGKAVMGSSTVTVGAQNVGISIWNLHRNPSSVYFNNSARDNVVGWAKPSLPSGRNDYWMINGVNLTNNQSISGTITMQHETDEWNSWKRKVSSRGITVGLLSGSVPVSTPSAISITSPSNNATFSSGANISVSASTSGSNKVSKVEFYNGSTKLGEDATSPYTFTWNAVKEGSYSLTTKAIYSNNTSLTSSNINIKVGNSTTSPPPSGTGQKIEAENFTKIADPGSNGAIQIISASNHSAGKSVRLFDKGDKIRLTFNATSGTYKIRARVRSGYYNSSSSSPSSYWPNGYIFTVNGQTTTFTGNSSTISGKDGSYGGSYWGTMNSGTVNLKSGANTVEIASNTAWAAIDYIELVPMGGSAPQPAPAPIVVSPAPTTGSQKIEAELSYSKLSDVGSNAIGEVSGSFSNGKSIRLYDVGDKIRITFNSSGGNYIVKARVRSGYYNAKSSSSTTYFTKYIFSLNGSTAKLNGDASTVSGKDGSYGGSYWGTMKSASVSLKNGTNTIDISTSSAFLGVDYIEIVPVSSGARIAQAEVIEEESVSDAFVVFPNPVQSTLNIEGIDSSEQISLSLYNSSGQPVFVNNIVKPENNKASLDLNSYNLKSGYYILKVKDGEKVVDRRVFKQ